MYRLTKDNLELIKESGEGATYFIKDGNDKVFKKYKAGKITKEKEEKLNLIEKINFSYSGICFPESIVRDRENKFVGYIMPRAYGEDLEIILRRQFKLFSNWTRINLVNLTLTILGKINFLHQNNIIIGDLKPSNIMILDDKTVYFVDTDSYQIGNYPCPVGTDEYTAPEILGKNFSEFMRTVEHDFFAVAVLLFKILVPGQHPYAHQGGGSPAENIKKGNFSYPFGDDANFKAPKGFWEIIWNDFPYEIKGAFYSTFKESKRISTREWIDIMDFYKKEILNGTCTSEIFPANYEKIVKKTVSTNFNRKSKGFGEDKTVISNSQNNKFAVLELSTKAVKLLFAKNIESLKNGFGFDSFFRKGVLTNTGDGLDNENYMDMEFFQNKVCPVITEMLSLIKQNDINMIYTIATAAYRGARNIEEILNFLKSTYSLNVKILSKEEEAQATLDAFLFSGKKYLSQMKKSNILLIDQGGGSTEISVFRNQRLLDSYSLNLGTTALKNIVFINSNQSTPLPKSFKEADKTIYSRLSYYFKQHGPKQDILRSDCVSVGSSITKATDKIGNKQQHGCILSRENIDERIRKSENELIKKYQSVAQLYGDIKSDNKKISDNAEHLFLLRLGLPMYLRIMDEFDIDKIIVSGTGLWYGVYYQKYLNLLEKGSL